MFCCFAGLGFFFMQAHTHALRKNNKKEKQPYQIHFGIFFHDALMFLRIVAIPAVTLPIVVQVYLYLTVFVWSDTCACELCANFSWPLSRQTLGVIICQRQNIIVINMI